MQLDYISLFSGIEAASVAWEPLGWNPVAFAEIEPFPCAVLEERFPDVPNLGDVTKVDWSEWHGTADLVIGGSPCQSFSVAGLRKGLADPRGNLMLEYLRACEGIAPEWIIWENVPGVLSSNGGRDFKALLEAVAELWPRGGGAWRVLDAQFFGVAQRRRRVFLVVNTRDWRRAAAVLQDAEILRGNSSASRAKRKELAGTVGYRPPFHRGWNLGAEPPEHDGVAAFKYHQGASAGSVGYGKEVCPTLHTDHPPAVICMQTDHMGQNGRLCSREVCKTLDTNSRPIVAAKRGDGLPCHAINSQNTGSMQGNPFSEEVCPTLDGKVHAVCARNPSAHTQYGEEVAGTLTARADGSPCPDRGANLLCFQQNQRDEVRDMGDCAGALTAAPGIRNQNLIAQTTCLGDDNGKAACDVELCGSLKVGGATDCLSRATAMTSWERCAPAITREPETKTSGEGKLICQCIR